MEAMAIVRWVSVTEQKKANGLSLNYTSGTTTSRPATSRLLRLSCTTIYFLTRQFYETHAKNVPQTLNPYLAVYHDPPAIATPGTRGELEALVRSAVSMNTKPVWGLLLALLVRQTLSLRLVVSYTPRVSVSLGT